MASTQLNMNDWISQVGEWQKYAKDIPVLVRDDIVKGKIQLEDPVRGVKSLLTDPLSVQYSLGYKDRKFSLTYDVLKRIPQQLGIVAAILQTRCNQVSAFSVPFRNSKSVGFRVMHKDPGHSTTEGEMKAIKEIESLIYNCGSHTPNPYNKAPRDDFETFLKKIVRDSLTYDQACIEVIPDRSGKPYEFLAVDASTIRIAAPHGPLGVYDSFQHRPAPYTDDTFNKLRTTPFSSLNLANERRNGEPPAYVQVVNGQVYNVYYHDELIFGVRNPRTDIYIQGYGYGELEQIITLITSHLYAEEYNRRFFSQGSAPKGLLNLKGDNFTPEMLEGFKRQWRANVEGVENSWKTPILQSEQGIEWIDLHPSNREMEYGQWLEYLIKLQCAVYLIDPAELNFDLHGGVQQTPLFESSQEWKLKASRDRGLKPLLRFIAKLINKHIVNKIDDHFVFDFVGLDELTEQEKHELRKEQVSSYMTLNEIRRAEDLPDVEDGDMILNPTYLQARQVRNQFALETQKQEQEQQTTGSTNNNVVSGAGAPGQTGDADQQAPQENVAPDYTGNFSKSMGSAVEIDLDTYKRLFRV